MGERSQKQAASETDADALADVMSAGAGCDKSPCETAQDCPICRLRAQPLGLCGHDGTRRESRQNDPFHIVQQLGRKIVKIVLFIRNSRYHDFAELPTGKVVENQGAAPNGCLSV